MSTFVTEAADRTSDYEVLCSETPEGSGPSHTTTVVEMKEIDCHQPLTGKYVMV